MTKKNDRHPMNHQVTLEPGSNIFDGAISDEEKEHINKHPYLKVVVDNEEQGKISKDVFIDSIKDLNDPNKLGIVKNKELSIGKPRADVLQAINEKEKEIQEAYEKGVNK